MKKIMNFVTMLCILNILMAGGLAAFLFATGRLDGDKVRSIADIVRHKGTPVKLREQVFEILEPTPASTAASQASSEPALASADPAELHPASAEERIAFARQAMEQERLALENDKQNLLHQQEALLKIKSDAEFTLKKIEDAKKESEPKAATAETKALEENFQKSLALYDELKTKQVKDIFFDSKNADLTARYLTAMDSSRAGKVIGEFKSPEEKLFIEAVLEKVRLNGMKDASGTKAASDMTAAAPGATPPAPVP